MMNTRVEMNEEMMAQVNGAGLFPDPVDVFFPESPEKKEERKETRNNLLKDLLDFFL